ncbi:hypothetical protein HMJ29_04030 [Hymenobacter taeanensis]|uniref:Nucleotide-diphospho-sugar transferase domain-containing protein n=1 Tax=Hymenobacter taeanensis TaxID=2735321 RepID=A0A6M6BCI9_9BACT|nr:MULTISPECIES: hypothetical protein [Hymenobacter]QJX46151.1 hypothetical protein HMJ29_04030 [Hymenobacter taeanensis]UOQ80007.1 hypothetical protein MUN83_14295 [Hymenobacter sp. 5414T-23]
MNYLIYLAYGSADIRNEAFYSILSYDQVTPTRADTQILIYTDDATPFQEVLGHRPDVQYPAVESEQWQAWLGAVNKVYLLKIGVLEHAAAHYPGNMFFLDTDTIWRKDPRPLFEQVEAGTFYMHQNEGKLISGNTLSRKVYKHLRGHGWPSGGHTMRVTPETELFNSGVLAFRSDKAYLLREVMALAEQLYATYNKHMMEQLAWSLRFAVEGPIADVPDYLWHYWNLKDARPVISQVVAKYGKQSQLLGQLDKLNLPMIHQQELAYRNLPSWQRTLRKLVGQRWKMPQLEV